jgi:hypothetical protein
MTPFVPAALLLLVPPVARAGDWPTFGGNPARAHASAACSCGSLNQARVAHQPLEPDSR